MKNLFALPPRPLRRLLAAPACAALLLLAACTTIIAPAEPVAAPKARPGAGPAPMCVAEGESCAAAGAKCCDGLMCGGSRQPLCISKY